MATPVLLVLAIVAMVSLVAVVAVVLQLVARVQRLRRDLAEIERDVLPRMARLQENAAVTSREAERVGRALDEVGERPGRRSSAADGDVTRGETGLPGGRAQDR